MSAAVVGLIFVVASAPNDAAVSVSVAAAAAASDVAWFHLKAPSTSSCIFVF